MLTLDLTATPDTEDLDHLFRVLTAFNDGDVGPSLRRSLAVFLKDEQGGMAAGLSGYTAWGWLYVQWLWVDAPYRGQGLAGRMLQAAEGEAVTRGCHGALIDTFSPVAEAVYRRQGYEAFGDLPDFPIGRTRIFMKKILVAS
jgi:GNAT superfamily N-acetyltransferase